MTNVPERTDRFSRACGLLPVDCTPVWLMRQAGRYMPEYRQIRARHTILEIIQNPELACEVTLQPVKAFAVDAAIIFADILPPLIGMGLELEFVKGEGPQINNPLRRVLDIDMLGTPPATATLSPTLEAIRLATQELKPKGIPLIGFAGAPFTLASYAVEGGGSKAYARTKALMYTEPAAWRRLMEKLVTVQADYLNRQVEAGASALQIFDSWAGLALSRDDYIRYVMPYNKALISRVESSGVPVIHFSTGTFAYLEQVVECGGQVVGVDWRMPLGEAWRKVGPDKAIMGNLDPVALMAPWRELKYQIDRVLSEAAGCPGHIFNTGHGILPETPVDAVRRLIDYVHEQTSMERGE